MEIINWRDFVKDNLSGNILEIGAMCAPYPVNSVTKITYQDRLSTQDLKKLTAGDPNVIQDKIVKVDVISDADTVPFDDNTFDAVITSHIFEHLKNPVKCLFEWLRVIKQGGYIYMVLPDYRWIFDKERQMTTLSHIIADYRLDVKEIEFAHYIDFYTIVNHDSVEVARENYLKQDEIKGANIHVHCFTVDSIRELLNLFSDRAYRILECKLIIGDICCLLQKI